MRKNSIDFGLLILVFVLLASGIVMVFSASYVNAFHFQNDSYYFLKKQIIWSIVGIPVMFFMSNFNYNKLKKYAVPLLILTCISLLLVFAPGIGVETKGARRWVGIGPLGFQPSEVAKIVIIIYLSAVLSNGTEKLKDFFRGLVPHLAVIGLLAGLIIIEPHLSSTVIVVAVGSIILFVAGARISHFVGLGMIGVLGIIIAVIAEPYRLDRIKAFMHPWEYATSEGWQITQSLMAIGSGGLFGLGLGKSRQKQLYIPEPHNDFVFSIIGEELGFLGSALVIILFIMLIWKGIKIAVHAPNIFGSLLATGITSLIALQVIINVAVVTSSMPVTGQPLPFFSAGGSSLVFLLAAIGILLNISRYCNYDRG